MTYSSKTNYIGLASIQTSIYIYTLDVYLYVYLYVRRVSVVYIFRYENSVLYILRFLCVFLHNRFIE